MIRENLWEKKINHGSLLAACPLKKYRYLLILGIVDLGQYVRDGFMGQR